MILMNIKRLFAAIFLSMEICLSAAGGTVFAENGASEDYIEEDAGLEAVPITDEIRRDEGYFECYAVFRDGIAEIKDDSGEIYLLPDGMSGNLNEGETKETVENDMTESLRFAISSAGADPDEYPFDVYVYLYDDYDYSPEEFLDFVSEDILARKTESSAEVPSAEPPAQNPPTGTAFPFAAEVCAPLCTALTVSTGAIRYRRRFFAQKNKN